MTLFHECTNHFFIKKHTIIQYYITYCKPLSYDLHIHNLVNAIQIYDFHGYFPLLVLTFIIVNLCKKIKMSY